VHGSVDTGLEILARVCFLSAGLRCPSHRPSSFLGKPKAPRREGLRAEPCHLHCHLGWGQRTASRPRSLPARALVCAHRAMEASWLETRWARPLHLAFAFCLALGMLQAIKLYLRRQRLRRHLRPFPAPPTHWLRGHQEVWRGGGEGAAGGLEGAAGASLPAGDPLRPSLFISPAALHDRVAR
jgi:hypothetical protein